MTKETSGEASGPDATADDAADATADDAAERVAQSASDDPADEIAAAERALADARARLADVPAEVVVTNHVMGLYELAAIHLSADPPDLASSALAIDAVAALVDGLGDRLGDDAGTMRDALANIRMAYVQVKSAAGQDGTGPDGTGQDGSGPAPETGD